MREGLRAVVSRFQSLDIRAGLGQAEGVSSRFPPAGDSFAQTVERLFEMGHALPAARRVSTVVKRSRISARMPRCPALTTLATATPVPIMAINSVIAYS